ncbi:MAG: TlpA disulfide reductase family protein [Candidatus Binataceae bacterium]|jgi:peroxiredoxin
MRAILPAIALLAMIILIFPGRGAFAAGEVGQPAPALVVQELTGQTFDLSAQRGKVVMINFWATWCAPCRAEMPALDAFYRQYHGNGLEMIGLSADSSHDKSDVRKVMQSFNYPAAMLNDADPNGFGDPDQIPETFVVDRAGVVQAVFTPDKAPVTAQSLASVVLPLLRKGGEAAAPSATR